jgi:hypothetical protein
MNDGFFDDDLQRAEPEETPEGSLVRPFRQGAEARLSQKREEMTTQAAGTVQQLERLRMRQEELEREKDELQQLTQRQRDYERSKRDIIEKLTKSQVHLEREEVQASRMLELLHVTRSRFREVLSELNGIDEESWPTESFQLELGKAMVQIENAARDYKRAIAKIDATSWHKASPTKALPTPDVGVTDASPQGFLYWLKVGVAVSLPLALVLVALFMVYLLLNNML